MDMVPVISSDLKEVGYDPTQQLLVITFKRGNRSYKYEDVPPHLYSSLIGADSVGSFFHAEIRNNPRYPCTPLS